MRIQTAEQIGVCSWSLQATGPQDLADKVNALELKRVQLGLTPHRDDPGTWEGVQEILAESGIEIVSGMFSTIGEDYSTPDAIRRTGGVVPDEHWDGNWDLAKAAAAWLNWRRCSRRMVVRCCWSPGRKRRQRCWCFWKRWLAAACKMWPSISTRPT